MYASTLAQETGVRVANPRSDSDMAFAAGTMVLPSFHGSDYELDTNMDNGRSSSPSVTEGKHEYRPLKPNENTPLGPQSWVA